MTEMFEEISKELKGVAAGVTEQSKNIQSVQADLTANRGEIKAMSDELEKVKGQVDDVISAIQREGVKGEKCEIATVEAKYTNLFIDAVRAGGQGFKEMKGAADEYRASLIERAEKAGKPDLVLQLKSYSSDAIATGGALIPLAMASKIIELQRDFSDVRSMATVEMSDIGGITFPSEGNDIGFSWIEERESNTDDNAGTFTDVEITMNQGKVKIGVTHKMMINRSFNMQSWIARKAAERLSRGEGAAFVTGDGHKKPKGMMTYAAGTSAGQVQQITTAASTTISHEDLTDLKTPLRNKYRMNANYFMNRFTEGYIEKLEDGQGNPLFNRGDLAKAIQSAIKGYPVKLFDDIAGPSETTGAFSGNELAILFGDLAAFYTITDHPASMFMQVDPYTSSDSGLTNFRLFKFVGGAVTNFEAAKILKIKA